MKKHLLVFLRSRRHLLCLVGGIWLFSTSPLQAQCPPPAELISGLQIPLGITQSNKGNLLVSETGTRAPNTGRISIVGPAGSRWTLLDGMPSGINDVNEPSGPAGLFMLGRTLYVAIGIGDSILPGPSLGTALPNLNPASPIFSSVLAVHFSANVEATTSGFVLTFVNQQALGRGERVPLQNGAGDQIEGELVTNFPDYTSNPLPTLPANVLGSNPFDLVVVGNHVYVTDGGQNSLWQVDIPTGRFSTLATFPNFPNPLFPGLFGPFVEAVPTGISYFDGRLLVALITGVPFPAGTSTVYSVDLKTGAQAPFIVGLKTAIDILPIRERSDTDYLVLQHASGDGPFFPPPGLALHFEVPGGPPTVLPYCLTNPTSMTFDEKTRRLYVTELTGRIVAIPIAP